MEHLEELKDLVATIRADRDEQKAKEKGTAWTKYVSLSLIGIAVLAAFATQKGGSFSSTVVKQLNEATFSQTLASDQWSFFQAKSIKQSLAEQAHDTQRVDRYEKEKKEISDKAKELEAKRDAARMAAAKASEIGGQMGLGTTLLQIAIAIGGICLVVKKRWLWYVSMSVGAIAAARVFFVLLSN